MNTPPLRGAGAPEAVPEAALEAALEATSAVPPAAALSAGASATLADAQAALQRFFGYPDFRRPQKPAIEAVLAGRDALVVLPTGGGKSLCFQVPALMRDGLTVVLSPLISLMKDQVDALTRRGLPATFLNSTLGATEAANRLEAARRGDVKLLYCAPERLDHGRTLDALRDMGVALLAVDEAHCISEWGHEFRPSYRRIGRVRHALGRPQTVALTATATPDVREDIVRQLLLDDPAVIVGGFDRTNLTYHVTTARTQKDKDAAAVETLGQHEGAAIVYTPTRKQVERVTQMLIRGRVDAVAYHAGLDDRHRQRAQDAFMQERARVIVATSAFGMGIDKPDVRLVVHHAMPGSLEAYYQEAGRAGRDGNPSTCVLLHGYADRFTHEHFIEHAQPGRDLVERVFRALRQQVDPDGFVPLDAQTLAAQLPAKLGAGKVHAAVRVLAQHGVLTVEPPAAGRVFIRLLATPERIARELTGERDFDREVLRALWRAVGRRIEIGATVDLDGLPPGFNGASGVRPVLERLQAEQFVLFTPLGGGFRLAPRAIVANHAPVDWRVLERRRQVELDRLEAMQGYAQTRRCRREFVLRYFGDPDAGPDCGSCDRCLGITATRPRSTRASRTASRRSAR